MSGAFYVIAIALVIIYFVMYPAGLPIGPESREVRFVKCMERGVNFFKEHDAYPVITKGADKGKKTVEVVRRRCDINLEEFKKEKLTF